VKTKLRRETPGRNAFQRITAKYHKEEFLHPWLEKTPATPLFWCMAWLRTRCSRLSSLGNYKRRIAA
jgi:hypothetical protein